jgi:hypothetical protein
MTFGTTHPVFVLAISPEMKHRGPLLVAAAEAARITHRLLAISLMLYTAILVAMFLLGIFLWGRTVKAQPAGVAPDFRHYSALAAPDTMSPSYPIRRASTNSRGIEQ